MAFHVHGQSAIAPGPGLVVHRGDRAIAADHGPVMRAGPFPGAIDHHIADCQRGRQGPGQPARYDQPRLARSRIQFKLQPRMIATAGDDHHAGCGHKPRLGSHAGRDQDHMPNSTRPAFDRIRLR